MPRKENSVLSQTVNQSSDFIECLNSLPEPLGGFVGLVQYHGMKVALRIYNEKMEKKADIAVSGRLEFSSLKVLGKHFVAFMAENSKRKKYMTDLLGWATIESKGYESRFALYDLSEPTKEPKMINVTESKCQEMSIHTFPGSDRYVAVLIQKESDHRGDSEIYIVNIETGQSKFLLKTSNNPILDIKLLSNDDMVILAGIRKSKENFSIEKMKLLLQPIHLKNWDTERALMDVAERQLMIKPEDIFGVINLHGMEFSFDEKLLAIYASGCDETSKSWIRALQIFENENGWKLKKSLPLERSLEFCFLPDKENSLAYLSNKKLYSTHVNDKQPSLLLSLPQQNAPKTFDELILSADGSLFINSYAYTISGCHDESMQAGFTVASVVSTIEERKQKIKAHLIPELADLTMEYMHPSYSVLKKLSLTASFKPQLEHCYFVITSPIRNQAVNLEKLFTEGLKDYHFKLIKSCRDTIDRMRECFDKPDRRWVHSAIVKLSLGMSEASQLLSAICEGKEKMFSIDLIESISIVEFLNGKKDQTILQADLLKYRDTVKLGK